MANVPRGVFAASRTAIGHGSRNCGVEAKVNFPPSNLKTYGTSATIREENFLDQDAPLFDGPMLEIAPGCLDMQDDPQPVS